MKTCTVCGLEKPFEAFSKSKDKKDGYRSSCRECVKLRYLELKKNTLMQLEKQINSSILLENKLLKRENKKLCSSCKEVFLIEDLSNGKVCKECRKEYDKEYNRKKIKNIKKNKEYQKQYRLKKKLERLQNNDTQI